jgi:acyl dehydratase
MKYFEDFAVGEVYDLGRRKVTADDIVDFARKYDPQPFHTDPEAAKQTFFGGLVASGWHTRAIFMGLLSGTIKREGWASQGAPGLDSCRWLVPVRPGDELSGTLTVLEMRRSKSRPIGLMRNRSELTNQKGEVVVRIEGTGMYRLKPSAGAEASA